MPPESLSTRVSRRSTRFASARARSIAARALGASDAVEVREHEQVLLDGERHVEVVELRRDAALRPSRLRLLRQAEAQHLELALVRDGLGGQEAHGRRLAGAVRPEQPDAGADRDIEVETVDGGDRAVSLDDAAQANRELVRHAARLLTVRRSRSSRRTVVSG